MIKAACLEKKATKHLFKSRGYAHLTPAFLCFMILLAAVSCTVHRPYSLREVDYSKFHDRPLTAEESEWLKPGEQSAITPIITDTAAQIHGMNRRERLFKSIEYFENNFKYDNWYNDKAFSRTADTLFRERQLGGCSDYGLVKLTLFRALGIPAKLVVTANVDWMTHYQTNDLLISKGHVFIEVFLEDKWYLVDSVYLLKFDNYDPRSPCYPRREYFCARGRDYWDIGIRNISELNKMLKNKALAFNEALYADPEYPKDYFYSGDLPPVQ